MYFLKRLLIIGILFIAGCAGLISPAVFIPGDQPHHGNALCVWVDGQRTEPLATSTFNGMNFFNHISGSGLWQVNGNVAAAPELKYQIDYGKLGEFTQAKATFEKFNPTGNLHWETYYSNLSAPTSEFEPGYNVASSHFQTAESDQVLNALPSGTYLVRLFVYGNKDWDTQAVFVSIP